MDDVSGLVLMAAYMTLPTTEAHGLFAMKAMSSSVGSDGSNLVDLLKGASRDRIF